MGNDHCDTTKRASQRLTPHRGSFPCITVVGETPSDPTTLGLSVGPPPQIFPLPGPMIIRRPTRPRILQRHTSRALQGKTCGKKPAPTKHFRTERHLAQLGPRRCSTPKKFLGSVTFDKAAFFSGRKQSPAKLAKVWSPHFPSFLFLLLFLSLAFSSDAQWPWQKTACFFCWLRSEGNPSPKPLGNWASLSCLPDEGETCRT